MAQIADYTLVTEFGVGNHGRFYKAPTPPRLGLDVEWVAVKVLDKNASEDDYRRFANELRLFASIDSPYLVDLLDAGQQAGTLYYSMPYFPLGSLAAPTRELSEAEKIRAVAHAARGAHALHEVGVAHRDIKPGNVLLHDDGAVLSDLGLAQVLNPGQTVTGTGPIGSIEFMEPGRVRGDPASRASDIWEIGVTLHRVLSGRSVYGDIPANDILSALRHILHMEPEVDEELPDAQRDVIVHCVQRAPEDRPGTAEQVAELLESLL